MRGPRKPLGVLVARRCWFLDQCAPVRLARLDLSNPATDNGGKAGRGIGLSPKTMVRSDGRLNTEARRT